MGTPEFAVPSLEKLVENGMNVVGVVTAPDKPKGRGKKLSGSPVKNYAIESNIQVLQPTNLKSSEFQSELQNLKADIQVVVAFRMLPEAVWSMPPKGTFNLHASMLPQYRGAAPINWAIINDEDSTGVTTFFLQHEIDTGSIIFQDRETINPEDDAGSLYTRLMEKGANLVIKTMQAIQDGSVISRDQDAVNTLKPAPKIYKETCEIDWNKSSKEIYNFIRGLSPYPGAWTNFGGKIYKIYKSQVSDIQIHPNRDRDPGVLDQKPAELTVFTGDGTLKLLEIQQEGKRRMGVVDFLKGNKI